MIFTLIKNFNYFMLFKFNVLCKLTNSKNDFQSAFWKNNIWNLWTWCYGRNWADCNVAENSAVPKTTVTLRTNSAKRKWMFWRNTAKTCVFWIAKFPTAKKPLRSCVVFWTSPKITMRVRTKRTVNRTLWECPKVWQKIRRGRRTLRESTNT